jgi:hypothetical protein
MAGKTGTLLDYASSSQEELSGTPIFKEGISADHVLGVLYQAPWSRYEDGFNQHARKVARAIAMTGVPLHLRALGGGAGVMPDPEARAEVEHLLDVSIQTYGVGVYQFVGESTISHLMIPKFSGLSEDELRRVRKSRILYTVFERDRISKSAANLMNLAGQVWTSCNMNADALEFSGVERSHIRVVPIPYFADDPLLKLAGRKRKPGTTRFYHIGKWEPRKAQHEMIGAFLMAFKPGRGCPQLYMKTTPLARPVKGYPQHHTESVMRWLKDERVVANGWDLTSVNRSLMVLLAKLSEEKITALHEMGDVYVTTSRGEGYDMPAYAAKLACNRMLYVPSGGAQDFAGEHDIRVEPSGKVPCHPMYEWGRDDQYLDFKIEDLVAGFQKAAANLPLHQRDAALDDFEASRVGKRALGYLEEVLAATAQTGKPKSEEPQP